MQITDLRSIVTDVRRLTLQIINGRGIHRDATRRGAAGTVVRDGNKYPPLHLLRFTLRKLRNARVQRNMEQELPPRRSLVYHFARPRRRYVARARISRIDVISRVAREFRTWKQLERERPRYRRGKIDGKTIPDFAGKFQHI